MVAASGLFLKLEEYKLIIDKFSVPASPLCGIVFASTVLTYNLFFPSNSTLIAGILLFILTVISFLLCMKRYSCFFDGKRGLYFSRIVLIIFLTFSVSSSIFFHIKSICKYSNTPASLINFSATVTGINHNKNSSLIILKSIYTPSNSELKIALYHNGEKKINCGDEIFIHKTINLKENHNANDNFESFKMRGIRYISSITDDEITLITKSAPGTRGKIKETLINKINSTFQKDTAGLIKALFIGNRNSVSKEATLKFRNAGVLHLLAASGLHVGIAAALPLFLLFFNLRKKTILVFSFLSVLSYLLVTDMPVSLLRAAIMFFLFAIQIFMHRKPSALNTLLLTGAIIIFSTPWEIFNIGFQLSFTATLGIILFYESYKKSLSRFPSYIKKSMAVSLSAQIFTVPIIIIHLNQFNTISLLSNIILIPMTTAFMYISFSSLIISSFIPWCNSILSDINDLVYYIIIKSAGFFADFNFNFFLDDNTNIIMFFMSLSLLPLFPNKTIKKLKAAPVFAAFILSTFYLKENTNSEAEELLFSAGNSTLIYQKKETHQLFLDIHSLNDADILINELKKNNSGINVIVLKNNSYPNQVACKRICNDFIIDECRFSLFPEFSNYLKVLIYTLENDNIKITFSAD